MIFSDYANYYNLLYKDKDYRGESQWIYNWIIEINPNAKELLEWGCGTGGHGEYFRSFGMSTMGLDLSQSMLDIHQKQYPDAQVHLGDLRIHRIDKQFDALVALFHVMSYQTENISLEQAFANANTHLKIDGAFIFDVWFGPGVLSDPPKNPQKKWEDERLVVNRKTHASLNILDNTVAVHFDFEILNKIDGSIHQFSENHLMRYLFVPECHALAVKYGFEPCDVRQFLGDQAPKYGTWYAAFAYRKVKNL